MIYFQVRFKTYFLKAPFSFLPPLLVLNFTGEVLPSLLEDDTGAGSGLRQLADTVGKDLGFAGAPTLFSLAAPLVIQYLESPRKAVLEAVCCPGLKIVWIFDKWTYSKLST